MGKIHDALEKARRTQPSVDDTPAVESPPAREKALKKEIKIVAPKKAPRTRTVAPPLDIDPMLVTYHKPDSVEAELFKILRTNILFPKKGSPPRSILVTSAIPGDGKSFVSSNLAISIAQGVEEHVLLMDCDMRRSSIHKKFGFKNEINGLSDYLSNGVAIESLLKKTVLEKLTILPGGAQVRNPAELLSSQKMKDLLQETKSRYQDRYIIVDSPPPQLTAETAALANYIDAVIVVIKCGVTPRELVKEIVEKMGREKVIGVVMNGYRVPVTERYGYGRYNRYDKEY